MLTVLLPLAVLVAIWVISLRLLRQWQRRAEQRNTPLPLTTGIFSRLNRYTEEDRREYWIKMKTVGRRRFIWRRGVLRWGLPMFVIFTAWIFLYPGTHRMTKAELIVLSILNLAGWILGGYWGARFMWNVMEKRYGE